MEEEKISDYDFYVSKTLYNLIALFGFLIIFMTGLYWGYTINQNQQYFSNEVKEIKFVNYINDKYTYNFIPKKDLIYNGTLDKMLYSNELSERINNVTLFLTLIGIILLEIGYRMSAKYKYKKPLKQRIKELIKRMKESSL